MGAMHTHAAGHLLYRSNSLLLKLFYSDETQSNHIGHRQLLFFVLPGIYQGTPFVMPGCRLPLRFEATRVVSLQLTFLLPDGLRGGAYFAVSRKDYVK